MDVQCSTFVPTGYERWSETNDSELPMAFLTSEDLLSGVRELEPAIFIILSVPFQSAVRVFFGLEGSMFKEGR